MDGDKIVIYSDGVTEAANTAGEFFGKKRLREILTEHDAASCAELHDAIQTAVSRISPKMLRNPTTSLWWCWNTALKRTSLHAEKGLRDIPRSPSEEDKNTAGC